MTEILPNVNVNDTSFLGNGTGLMVVDDGPYHLPSTNNVVGWGTPPLPLPFLLFRVTPFWVKNAIV